jgi:Ca2+-binding RTX toxin-like protein
VIVNLGNQTAEGQGDDIVKNVSIVNGSALDDTITGTDGDEFQIYGLGGDDHIYLLDGVDSASGGEGNDYISGGKGNDFSLNGDGGDDTIYGDEGDGDRGDGGSHVNGDTCITIEVASNCEF